MMSKTALNYPLLIMSKTPAIIYAMKILAQNVKGVTVPNSGHFIPEEQPGIVLVNAR
jgi:pimeloyl-ACP methyl ester carboxylesterase